MGTAGADLKNAHLMLIGHVHTHIDPGMLEPGTHYHLHIGSTIIDHDAPGSAEMNAAEDAADELAAVISGYGDAAVLRAIHDELTGAGFTGIAPTPRTRPQRYLSWIDPARERSSPAFRTLVPAEARARR